MKKCSKCYTLFEDDVNFCSQCGSAKFVSENKTSKVINMDNIRRIFKGSKTLLTIVVLILIVIAILTGGTSRIKKDSEIRGDVKEELISKYSLVVFDNIDVNINKRQTNKELKEDIIWVHVIAKNEFVSMEGDFRVVYELYNNGWQLEDFIATETHIVPKSFNLSNEQVLNEMIALSDMQIEHAYEDQSWLSDDIPRVHFFEEGKYATTIYSGDMISESEYVCIVDTTRIFEYVKVFERQLLTFTFDSNKYTWILSDEEILELKGTWFFEGEWNVPSADATIQINETGRSNGENPSSSFKGVCMKDDRATEFSFTARVPSTQYISGIYCSVGDPLRGPVNFELNILPDIIWCHDWNLRYEYEIDDITLASSPILPDKYGIIEIDDMSNEAEEYRTVAKSELMSLFNNDNAQHLKEIWYPTLSHLGLEDTLQLIKSGEVKINSAIHMQTMIMKSNTQDANEKEAFKELKEVYGCEAEEIVCCKYFVTRFWEEYGMEQIVIELLLIKEDGKIYIGAIG